MKKLEPGMLCRVIKGRNEGVILTLIRKIEESFTRIDKTGRHCKFLSIDNWWETDAVMEWGEGIALEPDGIITEDYIEPINPNHQPADEEWQADFKRMLCGDRQTAKG